MQKSTTEPLHITIGRNIKRWREFKDIKLSDMKGLTGLSESSISNYENGQTDFTTGRIEQFAEALQLTTSQLISSDPQSLISFHDNAINNRDGFGNQQHIDKELIEELRQQLQTKDRQIEFLQQSFAAR